MGDQLDAILERLSREGTLATADKDSLRTGFDGLTLTITWDVVEYSVEEVTLETEDDEEVLAYRLNAANKDSSRSYMWRLPGGASAAVSALNLEAMNYAEGIWYDLDKGHPVMSEYNALCRTYPDTALPEGMDDESVGEGYGWYGDIYTLEGKLWTQGYEPGGEEACFFHRKSHKLQEGLVPPAIWIDSREFTVEQARLVLSVLADTSDPGSP